MLSNDCRTGGNACYSLDVLSVCVVLLFFFGPSKIACDSCAVVNLSNLASARQCPSHASFHFWVSYASALIVLSNDFLVN